jgi:D-alanyl-D-alanine carboxypeptidase-like protein/calcineurin-like phosphoesterase family protein
VTWDNRRQRHIPEGTSPSTFPAADIAVRTDVKTDPISLSTPDNRLISLVGFGGGKGENSAIIGGIAKKVLTFYEKMQILKPLTYLHEIRISEDASNRLADGQYHLFWNNAKTAQDVPSDEMRLLIDHHAHPLRERTVWSHEGTDEKLEDLLKELLKEYEFEYGPRRLPYMQSYSRYMRMRGLPRAEVLHPLFVQRKQAEPLRIGHLTDLHVDVRADVYEANLEAAMKFVPKPDDLAAFNKAWETLQQKLVPKRAAYRASGAGAPLAFRSPSPWRTKADREELARLSSLPEDLVLSIAATQRLTKYWRKGSYNNLNRSFRENYTKGKAESDILLLTGDLIDYGRGHYGVEKRGQLGENWLYHEDRNWFLFYWLLAGDNSYTVPCYTILGNHDWRKNPYPPLAIAGAPDVESILNNYEEFIPEFRKWLLQIAHGPGHEHAFSYVSTAVGTLDLVNKDPAAALSTAGRLARNTRRLNIKDAPTETTVDSVMWYLLTINPFLDYSFPHPSGQKLLMLDWAEAEDVLFPIVERGIARNYEPWEAARASDPGPKAGDCLTAAQQKVVGNFLTRPGVSKLVGIHAPPIAPWHDWFDSELIKSRKEFPGSTVANRRRELGSFRTPEDCEKGEGKWDEDAGKCVDKGVPRGPDIVSTLPNGEKKRWNGHPLFAIRPRNALDGMVADYGSLVNERDWFITQLIEPSHGVRAVFSGHNHRDGLHTLWRMGPESGPQTNGTLRVRLLQGLPGPQARPGDVHQAGRIPRAARRVMSIKPGVFLGPLWVNTTSAGFRGHYRPSPGEDHYVPPGRALVSVRRDGTIDVAEFRRLPGIDKRALAVPAAVPPHSTPVAAESESVFAPQGDAFTPNAPEMTSELAVSDAAAGDFTASMEQESEASLDEGILLSSDAADRFLDRAERALRSSYGGRDESETSFLQRLLRELGCHVSAPGLSPAELSRAVLYNRPLMHNARDVLEVLAMPSQRPESPLQPGDWMLRAVPGTGDVGHVAVLASDDLLEQPMLASEGIAAESVQPGQYGLVIEAGAFPHSRSRPFARRWLDNSGCVLPHTVVLRPKYSDLDAMADFPPDARLGETEGTLILQPHADAARGVEEAWPELEWEDPGCAGEPASLDVDAEWFDSEIWTGSADQIAFRGRVLTAHLALSKKARGAPLPDLPDGALKCVPGTDIETLPDTAAAAGRLLAAATADLAKAQQAGDADALRTIRLSVNSGYRGSALQRNLWLGYFSAKGGYYDRTQAARENLPEGPHSDQAVAYMLKPQRYGGFGLMGRIAAPGYSNHQGGIAIDFWQERRKGHRIENKSGEESRARWRSTWFHAWLKDNAATYGFKPIPTEEWHWEYRRDAMATVSSRSANRPASSAPANEQSDYLGGKLWTFPAKTLSTPVAVFCPKTALSHGEVEVLLFAHGLLGGCPRPKHIPAGFITDAPFHLGRIVDAAGRSMALVVPFLDWSNPGGERAFGAGRERWHALAEPSNLNALVAEVLVELGRVRATTTPSLRGLIVAGHSRAYDFLEPLAYSRAAPQMRQGALAKLSQVWAFDTLYAGRVDRWIDWLNRDARLQVAMFYRPGSKTAAIGSEFYKRRSARLVVTRAGEEHCDVPATRLPALMELPAPGQSRFAAEAEEEREPRGAALAAESPLRDVAYEELPKRPDPIAADQFGRV